MATRSPTDPRLARAAQAQGSGRTAEARALLQAVIADDPANPHAHNMLGMAAMSAGDAGLAARHFEAARNTVPDSLPVLGNLAGAYRALGRDADEEEVLNQALSLDQRHLASLIRLAELHERRGQQHEATMRWSGVVALGAQLPDPAPALAERLDHARAFVARHTQALADELDAALAPALAAASERDRRRVTAAAQVMLGRRPVYVHQCEGMHYPFLPADEFFDRDLFPWFGELEALTDVIRGELEALLAAGEELARPYVQQAAGTPHNKWSVLDGKREWSAIHLWKEGARIDAACALAPRTAALVDEFPLCRIPGRAPTVFFSLLKAGAHIPAHTGVTNTRAIVHLPLIVPEGCEFRVGAEVRPWVEGQAFAFDDTIDHEAWNRSGEDRVVLICDCWNPHLSEVERAQIVTMYEVADRARSG